jgi:uncharacterized Zn finger protein (UPF0148 family)
VSKPLKPRSDWRPIEPLRLNCPRCGEKLLYVREDGDVSVYHCPNDGVVLHPPDGRVRVVIH